MPKFSIWTLVVCFFGLVVGLSDCNAQLPPPSLECHVYVPIQCEQVWEPTTCGTCKFVGVPGGPPTTNGGPPPPPTTALSCVNGLADVEVAEDSFKVPRPAVDSPGLSGEPFQIGEILCASINPCVCLPFDPPGIKCRVGLIGLDQFEKDYRSSGGVPCTSF